MYCQRSALAINVSGTIHLSALMLVSYLKHLSGCVSQSSSGGFFLYQSVGLSSVSCHRLGCGTEHSSKKKKKKQPRQRQTVSHGWDLLQWRVLQVSSLVPFHREDAPTHLYFDSYRQGVQLFVQFLENNKLFQREAAQPVEEKREREKGISGTTNALSGHLHDTRCPRKSRAAKPTFTSVDMDNNGLNSTWAGATVMQTGPIIYTLITISREILMLRNHFLRYLLINYQTSHFTLVHTSFYTHIIKGILIIIR